MSQVPGKDIPQVPSPSQSQVFSRCYICTCESSSTCELCIKRVCDLHTVLQVSSGQMLCATCDENVLKEEIRAEMQEELMTLGRDLQAAKEKLETAESQKDGLDLEFLRIQNEVSQVANEEKAQVEELTAQIESEESAFQQLLQDLSALQTSYTTLVSEDQTLSTKSKEAEEELVKLTAEKTRLLGRRKELAGYLEKLNKQMQETYTTSQLEAIACEQCKRRLQASYGAKDPVQR